MGAASEADVAAMYVSLPNDVMTGSLVATTLLADDDVLKQYEVHPGDQVFVLGFPLGFESNDSGFPILRSGWIASYPLLPSRDVGTFLIDFDVFEGNSGGPVYLVDLGRKYANQTHLGQTTHFIVGLVIQQIQEQQQTEELNASVIQRYPLQIAKVCPASFIKDTIAMLPAPAPTPASQASP